MRWIRLLPGFVRRETRALLLVYHSVSDDPSDEWSVSPKALRRQMKLLSRLGYQSLTFEELIEAFDHQRPLQRVVVISFDDGYLDTFTTAAPILAEFGFRGVIFVLPELVDSPCPLEDSPLAPGTSFASWSQLQALRDEGWEIGFHSSCHADLSMLSSSDALKDFCCGIKIMEARMGRRPGSLAYPWGRYSSEVSRTALASGFRCALAVSRRSYATAISNRFAMPRCPIGWNDSLLQFFLIVTLGYRTNGAPQRALKITWDSLWQWVRLDRQTAVTARLRQPSNQSSSVSSLGHESHYER